MNHFIFSYKMSGINTCYINVTNAVLFCRNDGTGYDDERSTSKENEVKKLC